MKFNSFPLDKSLSEIDKKANQPRTGLFPLSHAPGTVFLLKAH